MKKMGNCYNIFLELDSEEAGALWKIDFNFFRDTLKHRFYTIELHQHAPDYFRMDFCEHDDQLHVLLAIAKIIKYFESRKIHVTVACLDGLEEHLVGEYWKSWEDSKDDKYWGEVINQKGYMLRIFKKVKILKKKDKAELNRLKKEFKYEPWNLPYC